MNNRIPFWWLLVALVVLLAGCGGENNDTLAGNPDPWTTPGGTARVFASFDASVLPLPNDVTWAADGNPAVDLPASADDSPEMAQLKQLVNAQGILGLSPNMFLTLPLTDAVDSSTLELLVFRIDDPNLLNALFAAAQTNPAGVPAALAALDYRTQADFVIVDDFNNGVVKLLPKTPFTPGAGYAVVAKSGLLDVNGYPVTSSFTMRALKTTTPFAEDSPYFSFEALRAAFNDGSSALFTVVGGVTNVLSAGTAPWTRDDVLVMWTFHTAAHTLSLTPTALGAATVGYPDGLTDPFALTTAGLKGLVSMAFTTNALSWVDPAFGTPLGAPVGIPADILLAGTGIPTDAGWTVYAGNFQSPSLDGSGALTVTFRLTVPAAGSGPYPVVVFQHGITSSKDAALPITNSLTSVGFATLAIDAIYHGERTLPGAESGDGFFTSNLIQARANLYQAALDLWEAVDVISDGIDLNGDMESDLDSSRIEFIAHSLGSIIGSVFLSQETRVDKIVLSSPSSLLVNVLDETSLPTMQALVASLGYTPGTTEYYVFLDLAQWLIDPADATYNGIGGNPTANLMALYAFGDPIVSPDSSKVFLTNLGLDLADTIVVDPDLGLMLPDDLAAGAYQYGLAGKPVVHSFMISPLFDPVTEPWYADCSADVQINATTAAQMQVAGYLMP